PPNVPVFTKDGEYGAWQFANPVATALEPRYANTNLKFTGNMNFAYRLFKGKKKNEDLKLMLDLSTDYNGYIEDHYEPPTTTQGIPSGVGVYTSRNILRYVVEPYLIYKGSFDEDNTFNLVAGMTFQKTTDQSSFTVGEVFPTAFNSLTYVASAAQVNSGSSNIDRRGFQSYFGRFSYSFKEKYNVDVSGRADGSGAFGPDRRYGMFWSVGAGWIISDEAFFEDLSETVNLLKLRASYGLVGNDQIGNNIWQKSWGVTDYNGMPASNVARIGNPALSWESSNKFDVGVEAAFFQDKVSVNLGFYNTNTTGLLFAKQFPSSTGFFSQTYNIGKSNNRGVELEVRGSPINRSTTGGLKWDVNVNLAYSTNEVVELVDEEPIISGFGSAVLIGRPFNSFYALKSTGVDPATGNMMYEDVNGDGIFNQEDYQFLGAGFTPFYGGITNTLSWKNLSLDMFWQVNIGNEIYNSNWEFIQSMGSAVWNQDASTLNRWRQAGDVTDVPRAGIGSAEAVQNNLRSSRFVLDGSFGRLKNLALSYTVPKDLLKKAKIESLRLTLSGQNLWTITRYAGFDPEVSTFGESNSAAGTDFLT
ncbi:MAG: SusC/RagA family TonB-linked outer membrane protein, partial [Runella slithyformis]